MTTRICIVGTGYVGVSLAVLLAQRNAVTALDIVAGKVRMLNARQSPIEDPEILDYLINQPLNLHETLDKNEAYATADFVAFEVPTRNPKVGEHLPPGVENRQRQP